MSKLDDRLTRIDENKNFLNLLCHSKKKIQKLLIENASRDQIYSICEIFLNILNGNIPLDKEVLKRLSTKKRQLRQLVKRGPVKEKKYLIQKGGFLQLLIPALITGLASIVSSVIEKA